MFTHRRKNIGEAKVGLTTHHSRVPPFIEKLRFFRLRFFRLLLFLFSLILSSPCGIGAAQIPVPASASGSVGLTTATATLTILYSNDTHSHLLPFDLPKFGKNVGGISRRYEYFKQVRSQNPILMILDGGDIFQGSPFYSFFKGEVDVKAFTLCGYDATTLGNHELDDGISNILEQYKKSGFPMICSNIFDHDTREPVFPQFKMFDRAGRSIAVLGCIGSEAWSVVSNNRRKGLDFVDPEICLPPLIKKLRQESDLLILLSHAGYSGDVELASSVSGIDLIVGGHTNTFIEHPVLVKSRPLFVPNRTDNGLGGTLVVQAFKWGYYVGRIDLDLGTDSRILAYRGDLHPLDASTKVPFDSPVERLVSAYDERIRALTGQVIGECTEDMPYPEEEKHLHDLPLGTLVCDALRDFGGGDIAIVNSGSIRDALFAGPVTMGRLYSVLPFDNTIVTLSMAGSQLHAMLQFICANYGRITGYQYSGLTFTFDLDKREVRDILIHGKPLDESKNYRVVTISYLTDGNQNGNMLFKDARNIVDAGYFMREALVEMLKKNGRRLVPPKAEVMTFVPPLVIPETEKPGNTTDSLRIPPPN